MFFLVGVTIGLLLLFSMFTVAPLFESHGTFKCFICLLLFFLLLVVLVNLPSDILGQVIHLKLGVLLQKVFVLSLDRRLLLVD